MFEFVRGRKEEKKKMEKKIKKNWELLHSHDIEDNEKSIFWEFLGEYEKDEIEDVKDRLIDYCQEDTTKEDLENYTQEIADGLIDIYHADRYKWLNFRTSDYVDEAKAEFGESETISDEIAQGQFLFWFNLVDGIVNKL